MIDIHTHIFSPQTRTHRHELVQEEPAFGGLYGSEKARMVSAEELIASMDEHGVDVSVACGFPWESEEQIQRENDYILECGALHPKRIIPFITLPQAPDQALAELARGIQSGAGGVGEMAPGTYGDELWDLKSISLVGEAIREAGIPLLIHCNEPLGHTYPGKGSIRLRDLEALIGALKGVRLILAHLGGGFLFFETMPEIAALCQDVVYDTAAVPYLYHAHIYRTAITILGADRLLFGSDFPLLPPKRYLRHMQEGGLTEQEIRRMTHDNAINILRVI
jgi:predicted TIM-barrel fold metal-dependent hydrolase